MSPSPQAELPPLPHGTEVTTGAEKELFGRRVARGLIGRVVKARGGGYDVLITGLGEVWYAADELAPRRGGQLEFARRREESWNALWPCRVLEATVGSRAWGLADERSDVDLRGAFALPLDFTLGLHRPPDSLVSADGSQTYWEVRKLVEQALRADPNTLELLFVPSVVALDDIGRWILEAREAFVSKLLFGSFGRYALSQLDKLRSAQRLAEHRDRVLDWLVAEPTTSLDQVAERLAKEGPDSRQGGSVQAAKLYLKQLYRSLADQGLIERADFASLVRYAIEGGRRPPDARALRPKNAYNLLRLIDLATGWLATGAPRFAATGEFRERLLSIKRGEVPLEDVLRAAEAMTPALEMARDGTALPELPDYQAADRLLHRVGLEVARRAVTQAPGPWGREAPMAPLAKNPDESEEDR